MPVTLAKLAVCQGSNVSQEFLLHHNRISIGRAPDNNIILSEPDVSRHHAQIVRTADGYAISDLGSSAGTRVNNTELSPRTPRPLASGNVIHIGKAELRFYKVDTICESSFANLTPPLQDTLIASQPASNADTVVIAVPSVPVLCVYTPKWTQEFLLDKDVTVLGRAFESDIVIDIAVVSVQHAELRKCGAGYEIVDLNSTNGLVYEGRHITQKILSDGDVLYISSDVMLVYQAVPVTATSTLPIKRLELGGRSSFSIGRNAENDTVIDHPAVSHFHARIQRQDGFLVITDLKSTNGTFVNGKRLKRERVLKTNDVIRIGSYRLVLNIDETLVCQNEEGNLRLDALHINKVTSKGINVLQDISLSVRARELVAISSIIDAEKSTLLAALSGFSPATSGVVFVNDTDLYKNFPAYCTELGYVPQDNIIHQELTIVQALDYVAKLRMPADTSTAERHQRIQEILADLELTQCQDVLIRNLSCSQRQRVPIGVELLTKPSLLFLDADTSGLEPGTEAQMMKLLRKLADQGRTILLTTHATKNVMMCDLVVFLTKTGYIAYFGSPEAALSYFRASDFDEIYSKVKSELSPEQWYKRYQSSPQYQQYIINRQRGLEQSENNGLRLRLPWQLTGTGLKRISVWQQFLILSQRYLAVLFKDRASLVLMLGIAPILGLLNFVIWQHNLFDVRYGNATQALTMLFITAFFTVIVGSLATVREIVKEQKILRHERRIGVQIAPYILSKVGIGVLLALYQAAVLLLTMKLAVDLPSNAAVWGSMYVTLSLSASAGMMMGLLVSVFSPNQNTAAFLTMLFLVFQLTFGGGILPVKTLGTLGQFLNQISITNWSFRALVTTTGLGQDVAQDPCWQLPAVDRQQLTTVQKSKCDCIGANIFTRCLFPGVQAKNSEHNASDINSAEEMINRFLRDYGETFNASVTRSWQMLGLETIVMFSILFWVQKRKDISS